MGKKERSLAPLFTVSLEELVPQDHSAYWKSRSSIVVGCFVPDPLFGYRGGSSVYFAHLFEEFREVLTATIVDTSCADEKSHKAFEACQRLLAWLSPHIGLDIGHCEI